ncbi:MAG: hypothetical protein IJB84_01800 [Lachnospiraceae bacterium]|nr:hypothetical protein [Lachnospiraceae bacterium]
MKHLKSLLSYKKTLVGLLVLLILLLLNGYGTDKAHYSLSAESVNQRGQQVHTPHFSYPKGEYQLSVDGSGRYFVYTADGNLLHEGNAGTTTTFVLEKDESDIIFCCEETGMLSSFTIVKEGSLYSDVTFISLFVVAFIAFALYKKNKKGPLDDNDISQLILIGIAVLATFPAFTDTILFGHDLNFHLYRIEGIKDGLLAGQFPVRVHPTHNNGYGYITPGVYPELFFYIPAIFRILGMSAVTAYHTFFFCINIATAFTMYFSVKGITKSSFAGQLAAIVYTFSTWRVINLYYRAALGEALSMIFFPLVFYGLFCILRGNHKKWWILTIGCTGVFMSHIISTVMVALMIVVFLIVFWKDFIQKDRFLAFVKMGVTTVTLNAWFLAGFLTYYLGLDLSIKYFPENTEYYQHALFPSQLFNLLGTRFGYSYLLDQGVMHDMSATLGVGITVALVFVFCYHFLKKNETAEKTFAQTLFWMSLMMVLMTTTIFPWRIIQQSPLLNSFCGTVRLPSRFLSPASACITILACVYVVDFIKDKKAQTATLAIVALVSIFAFTVWGSAYTTSQGPVVKKGQAVSTSGAVGFDNEYYIQGTSPYMLEANRYNTGGGAQLVEYEKDRTNIDLVLSGATEGSWVEVPLLWYPGYKAKDNAGNRLEIVDGDNHVLRVLLENGSTQVHISYTGLWYFRIAELISLLTIGWFIWAYKKKKI